MPVRRTSRFPVARPARRKLVWATHFMDTPALASGTTTNYDLLSDFRAVGGTVLGLTVMRIRAQFVVSASSLVGAWHIGIVVGRLADVSTTRIDPAADSEIDWMLLRKFYGGASGAAADAQTVYEVD